jgi:hypothetical protein
MQENSNNINSELSYEYKEIVETYTLKAGKYTEIKFEMYK